MPERIKVSEEHKEKQKILIFLNEVYNFFLDIGLFQNNFLGIAQKYLPLI